MRQLKFTKETLNNLLSEIEDVYFNDRLSISEAITVVKDAYKEEIETLEDGPVWIVGVDLSI